MVITGAIVRHIHELIMILITKQYLFSRKIDISPDVFYSLVTDLENANKRWHRMDCSDER